MMSIKRVNLSPYNEGYSDDRKPTSLKNIKTKKKSIMIMEAAEFSLSAVRFLKHVGANMARLVSSSEQKGRRQSGRKVVSSAAAAAASQLGRSRSYAESSSIIIESHLRAEAIEDCIEFLNSSSSSSSLHRSSSVSSSCINVSVIAE